VKPIQGQLKSAFPIRPEFLRGELGASDVQRPNVDGQIAEFEQHWRTLLDSYAIEPLIAKNELSRRGRLRASSADESELRGNVGVGHEFTLELRSQAAGDSTLLRCGSFVGSLDLRNDEILDEVYEMQVGLGHPRVCISPDERRRLDQVSIHHEILFHPTATQTSEIYAVIERTTRAASRIHEKLIQDHEERSKHASRKERRR
jgi:hypothetical protein